MSVEDLIKSIHEKSKSSEAEIKDMIESKMEEFGGMITKEAAAHLVARDLDIDIPRGESARLQIKNIVTGMRGINIVGRVFKITPINEFQKKNGDKGRVANVFISDGTGYIRVPLWNDQVKLVEDELVKPGDAVQIFGGLGKDNIYGEVEISVGKFGGIRKIDDDSLVPGLEAIGKNYFSEGVQRAGIADLVPGNFEIKGTIVQVMRGNFLFETNEGEKALVISCILDDGTGDIRTVFFRTQGEQISGLAPKDLENLDNDAKLDIVRRSVMGKEIIVSGKVKKNKFFDALEMVADSVKGLNPLEESKRIAEELEAKIGN